MAPSRRSVQMSTNFQEIGERLRKLRAGAGLTQAEFAETLGTSLRSYKGYETGQRELPTSVILRLRDFGEVSPSWLLTGERDKLDDQAEQALRSTIGTGLDQLHRQTHLRSTEAWSDFLMLLIKLSLNQEGAIKPADANAILNIGSNDDRKSE
ncbi:helix-turn-helix domain-containing protein [Maricaulis maris]|uniref:helix-turn-helix domain-containing protein n=2 Tax=Alphaproteobacteria TaxID=28211 RepID=UPI003A906A0F